MKASIYNTFATIITALRSTTLWTEAVVSGILLPVSFEISNHLIAYFKQQRPLNALISGYLEEKHAVLIFLAQLKAIRVDNNGNWQLDNDPKYLIQHPMPIPQNKDNLKSDGRQNIDPVWAEGDGECLADIYNVLGRAGKTTNVRIANLVKDWNKLHIPTFTIGFNPKTEQLMSLCHPIYFESENNILSIKGTSSGIKANFPNDPSVIQKTCFANSKAPVFILAGLGATGTSSAGYYLRQHCVELGKIYGSAPFCALLNTNVTNTKMSVKLEKLHPSPSLKRIFLHPLLYFRLKKRRVFLPRGTK